MSSITSPDLLVRLLAAHTTQQVEAIMADSPSFPPTTTNGFPPLIVPDHGNLDICIGCLSASTAETAGASNSRANR